MAAALTEEWSRKIAKGSIRATFWRGGTSRGIFLRAIALAHLTPACRDRIILSAMGSPDPDLRQIDGLGGGASSLSKVAVLNAPGKDFVGLCRLVGNHLPGVAWTEDTAAATHPHKGWDVVFRFGQVPINGTKVDWSSTCGNLLAAVAKETIADEILDKRQIDALAEQHGATAVEGPQSTFLCPVRIMTAHNGNVVLARVPVSLHKGAWRPHDHGDAQIAGVPGTGAPVIISSPLNPRSLPTRHQSDTIIVGRKFYKVSIIDAGLPNIFVRAEEVGVSLQRLTMHPEKLEADLELMKLLEGIREAASALNPALSAVFAMGSAAPKVCLVHRKAAYTTTGGEDITADQMDCLVRAVSVGQIHRTVPATTLSALAVASALKESTVAEAIRDGNEIRTKASMPQWTEDILEGSASQTLKSIIAGQPAGLSRAFTRVVYGRPKEVVMERTARRLMQGSIEFPNEIVEVWKDLGSHVRRREEVKAMLNARTRFLATASPEEFDDMQAQIDKARKALNDPETSTRPSGGRNFSLRTAPAKGHFTLRMSRRARLIRSGMQLLKYKPTRKEMHTSCSARMPIEADAQGGMTDQVEARIRPQVEVSDATQYRHLFRHLLRSVSRNPSLQARYRRSLKNLISRDFRKAAADTDLAGVARRVEHSLLLLLSSSGKARSRLPGVEEPESSAWPLSRLLLWNLASLSYHHLAPNTLMFGRIKHRFVGPHGTLDGTSRSDASKVAQHILLNAARRSASEAGDGQVVASGGGEQGRVIASLIYAPRPVRGPNSSRSNGPPPWDGQNYERWLSNAEPFKSQSHEAVRTHLASLVRRRQELHDELVDDLDGVRQASLDLDLDLSLADIPAEELSKRNLLTPSERARKYDSLKLIKDELRKERKKHAKFLYQEDSAAALRQDLVDMVRGCESTSLAMVGVAPNNSSSSSSSGSGSGGGGGGGTPSAEQKRTGASTSTTHQDGIAHFDDHKHKPPIARPGLLMGSWSFETWKQRGWLPP